METTLEQKTETESKNQLNTLKQKRNQLNSEIGRLSKELNLNKNGKKIKNNPESKISGETYYIHSEYKKGLPRITLGGYVQNYGENTHILYWGAYVCTNGNLFKKSTGRIKAMGQALSRKRGITKLQKTDHDYVRTKLTILLQKIQLDITEKIIMKSAKTPKRVTVVKSQVLNKRIKLTSNGTH